MVARHARAAKASALGLVASGDPTVSSGWTLTVSMSRAGRCSFWSFVQRGPVLAGRRYGEPNVRVLLQVLSRHL